MGARHFRRECRPRLPSAAATIDAPPLISPLSAPVEKFRRRRLRARHRADVARQRRGARQRL